MVSKLKNQIWAPKMVIKGPKIEISNFELEIKLAHHFYVGFRDESNGNSLKAQKPSLAPLDCDRTVLSGRRLCELINNCGNRMLGWARMVTGGRKFRKKVIFLPKNQKIGLVSRGC